MMAQQQGRCEKTMTPLDASRKDVLTASDAALAMVLALRADEENATALALWIEVTGTFAKRVHLRHLLPVAR